MTYTETINYLFTQLPMFQRVGAVAFKKTLQNIVALDEALGFPHKKYKTIHVAGTNGKGSVSHILASVLQEAGFKVGLYTSPHLRDFRERIKVNGCMISEEEVVAFVEKNKFLFEKIQPSFFEMTVAMAFHHFEMQKVDIAVIEVGLGGRLDSTNIISPLVSVITNIGFDHQQLLGNTLPEIAAEKAGIIKPQTPVVVGDTNPELKHVFQNKAGQENSKIYFANDFFSIDYVLKTVNNLQVFNVFSENKLAYKDLKLDLLGIYQKQNVITALKTIEILIEIGLNISTENIYSGFESAAQKTGLSGRWQILGNNPLIVCDTGHNEDGIKAVVQQISQTPYKELHFVLGAVNDKDIDKILKLLPQNAHYYFTQAAIPRALPAEQLAEKASACGLKGKIVKPVAAALQEAKNNAQLNDLVFVGGSTFVVAEVV